MNENNYNYERKNISKKNIILIIISIVVILVITVVIIINTNNKTATNNKSDIINRDKVSYITNRSVQFDEENNQQILFFGFKDDNGKEISSSATVNIKIINNKDEEVYSEIKTINKTDFSNWTSPLYGNQYLTAIYIKNSDITLGSSSSGNIKFSVYNKKSDFYFEETVLTIDDLPFKSNSILNFPTLPFEVNSLGYNNKKYTTFKFTDIEYKFEESYDNKLKLIIEYKGEKIYDYENDNNYCTFDWKLYKDDYVIDTGSEIIGQLDVGDKVANEKITIYDLESGEYYIEFIDD